VLQHLKGDKVIVFKEKKKKRIQKRNGHRTISYSNCNQKELLLQQVLKGLSKKRQLEANTEEAPPKVKKPLKLKILKNNNN
jgi:hypothetical protein